jgi:hypothetical protein
VSSSSSDPSRESEDREEAGLNQSEPEKTLPLEGEDRRRGPRIDLTTLKGSWSQRREQRKADREDADETP